MKYDDAEYYFLNFETDELENAAGATHMGMFMAWMIMHELVSDFHREDGWEELERVKARQITGAHYVIYQLDCKLLDVEFSELGNAFAAAYYEKTYLLDYMDAMGVDDSSVVHFCSVADTWINYDKIARLIDRRFDAFKKERQLSRRPAPPAAP